MADGKNILKIAGRFFLLNCAATLVVVSIRAAGDWSAALAFKTVFSSFVYSNCIGSLTGCAVIFGVPAWRENKPFFRFVFLTAAILAATSLGIATASVLLVITGV